MLKICRTIFGLGGGERQEYDIGPADSLFQAIGEYDPLVGNVLLQEVGEPRFKNGALPLLEHPELPFVIIHTDDIIAAFGKACPHDKPYVAGANNTHFQGRFRSGGRKWKRTCNIGKKGDYSQEAIEGRAAGHGRVRGRMGPGQYAPFPKITAGNV